MIEAIGWIALAAGGAWCLFVFALLMVSGMGLGGFERLPAALFAGAACAVAWLIFIVWLSPLTIGFSG